MRWTNKRNFMDWIVAPLMLHRQHGLQQPSPPFRCTPGLKIQTFLTLQWLKAHHAEVGLSSFQLWFSAGSQPREAGCTKPCLTMADFTMGLCSRTSIFAALKLLSLIYYSLWVKLIKLLENKDGWPQQDKIWQPLHGQDSAIRALLPTDHWWTQG